MADGTKIEWTDATWNPITGCSVVSPGCTNCYAMKLAGTRLKNHPSRKGLTRDTKAGPVWTGEVRFNAEWLDQPLRWTKPRMIFVCAHGDLFAEGVPDEWIDQVFAVMALCPQHTFQVLTKRPERMREYLKALPARSGAVGKWAAWHWGAQDPDALHDQVSDAVRTPLPNVWLGVSVEDQRRAKERIPILLDTPAAIRWISAEPLLGPVDIRQWQHDYGCGCGWGGVSPLDYCHECGWRGIAPGKHVPENCPECGSAIEDYQACPECDGHDGDGLSFGPNSKPHLDWVVAGGESGPDARPMHPDWARSLRDQCAAAGVPFLFKQWGEWAPRGPESLGYPVVEDVRTARLTDRGENGSDLAASGENHVWMQCLGKRRAGRLLDGVEHNGYPEVRHA
ncbi:DUF5131 family protein [Ciceribacter ferrooxidans]|uniref:DUF5131 family protein n=1 Tax=Ciceribacter ferrooxidans TaxID=2509717 RepID=A0A4Q2SZL0_9HYPH|nr:phage Gp37/Gp68 family protein [Ciceribacter ferrooxidans]RYC10040.1 DUF5131 family protein [Ciceribacter ferrooxidans]